MFLIGLLLDVSPLFLMKEKNLLGDTLLTLFSVSLVQLLNEELPRIQQNGAVFSLLSRLFFFSPGTKCH